MEYNEKKLLIAVVTFMLFIVGMLTYVYLTSQ
jgi:hypothetical protein